MKKSISVLFSCVVGLCSISAFAGKIGVCPPASSVVYNPQTQTFTAPGGWSDQSNMYPSIPVTDITFVAATVMQYPTGVAPVPTDCAYSYTDRHGY